MIIAEKYFNAQKELFDHVGFTPDWVEYSIDDATQYLWTIEANNKTVKYAETLEKMTSGGEYYEDEIYTQRFYDKWVYEGKDVTMIFCDPHVDGCRWFKVFDNKKRIK